MSSAQLEEEARDGRLGKGIGRAYQTLAAGASLADRLIGYESFTRAEFGDQKDGAGYAMAGKPDIFTGEHVAGYAVA